MSASTATTTPPLPRATPDWLGVVADKVHALRFGVVQITVHEGRVTQVEVTEPTRFDRPAAHRTGRPD